MRTIVLAMMVGTSMSAPVSHSYLCVQGHEQDAVTKLQMFIKNAVTSFFKDRKIAIDPPTLQINISSSTQAGWESPPYLSFSGSAAASAIAGASSIGATVAAQDGTKFNVLFSSGSGEQNAAEYRIQGTQQGFDKEGNAIHPHCTLQLFNSGDDAATKSLLVINATSGHTLGLIRLPSRISLY
ncbi:MAG TPA: hypothetical protein VKW08_08200 [Xanthobacteraceae bacterium]|nr:hypothetical protein [Xanthobacteraceae bacterium]